MATKKSPQYNGLKPVMCHFEPEIHSQMKEMARRHHRSLKAQSEMILIEALQAELAQMASEPEAEEVAPEQMELGVEV